MGLALEEFERSGGRGFGNEFGKLAPALRGWRVGKFAGDLDGPGFMTSWVGEAGGRLELTDIGSRAEARLNLSHMGRVLEPGGPN